MSRTLIVANWKMNLDTAEASLLVHRLAERIKIHRGIEIVLAPSMLTLQPLSMQIDRRKFRLCAQNAFQKDEGAYTGEVSFTMLRDLVHYVIVGHSERRIYFYESLDDIRHKVAAALRNEISPIICVGENQEEHRHGETRQVLHDQVVSALSNVTSVDIDKVVIAYDPIWSISTMGGELAKPDVIKRAIDFIRLQVHELYGPKAAKDIRIIYGGSVNENLARGYLEIDGCDGVLVGAASLNYHKFSEIVDTAYRLEVESRKSNGQESEK